MKERMNASVLNQECQNLVLMNLLIISTFTYLQKKLSLPFLSKLIDLSHLIRLTYYFKQPSYFSKETFMQLLRFVGQNIKPIFYLSALVISNFYLIKYLSKRNELIDYQQKISQKPIITLEEAVQIMKSSGQSKSDNSYLIKAYPNPDRIQISTQKPVHSNQVNFIEPSLNKIASQATSLLNYINQHKNDKDKKWQKSLQSNTLDYNRYWIVGNKSKLSTANISIDGYGEIVDHQIFDIKTSYQQLKDRGLIKNFLESLAYFFQWLSIDPHHAHNEKIKRLTENQDRAPFIKGPVIGSIRYLFNFIADKPILIEAKIQGNKIIPITLSSSKAKLLQNIGFKIFNVNFQILQCVAGSFLAYKLLRPHLGRLYRTAKKLFIDIFSDNSLIPKRHETFRMLQSSQIKDNLLCIICYTNCRNTILFNCKHMIMCDWCKDFYKENHCPLCKAEIIENKKLVKMDTTQSRI